MLSAGSQKTEMELRTLLGCFLFSGDDADKRIRVLSGGEKARVALAKTIISRANFLMLDEPTNHLDMHSVDLLVEALDRYEGSLILVSHDRYFISKTANKIWSIENGQIVEFKGGYEEWVAWNERMAKQAQQSKAPIAVKQEKKETPAPIKQSTPPPPKSAPIDKDKQKEQRRLEKRFSELEQLVTDLQLQSQQSEARLADPEIYSDHTRFQAEEKNYQEIAKKLESAEKEYEDVFEKLSSF
jgi:ATP-binding cassette subfamily F protein 3